MTNLHHIFQVFDSYKADEINNCIAEAKLYLKNGAKEFSKTKRPIDITESVFYLNQLEKLFDHLIHPGDSFHLCKNGVELNFSKLIELSDSKCLQSHDADLKILSVNLVTVLNKDNIASYQKINEFISLLSASFDSM